jgi:hypothetical protein
MPQDEIEATTTKQSLWTDKTGIAAHFKYSVRNVGNMMRGRKIPFYKVGRCVRFNIPECEQALQAYRVNCVQMPHKAGFSMPAPILASRN